MKKEPSVYMKKSNRRILRRLMMLSIASFIVILLLFYAVEVHHIHDRAQKALTAQLPVLRFESDEILPEIYYVILDDYDDGNLSDTDAEAAMVQYYMNHKDTFQTDGVYHFSYEKYELYFSPRTLPVTESAENTEVLVYADVGFAFDTVRTAAQIMTAVMGLLALAVYYVGRRTIRILDDKDQRMKDFFANASHELKTPLMAIGGYADGIDKGIVSADKGCSVIAKEVDRMSGLIGSILEISKIDSRMVAPHMEINDVREILYDVITAIEPAAKQKNIAVEFDLPDPILYSCDEDMLFSVFSNVLTNSIRYADTHISIAAEHRKVPSSLMIRIANDGRTVSEEDAAHLFERFYKGAGGQTGLGMNLSLEYMQLMGGTVAVSVADGETVFEITL